MMNKVMLKLLTSLMAILLLNLANLSAVQASEETKSKRVPALRAKVYSQLAKGQKLADEGKTAEAIAHLDKVSKKQASMNSYEIAMMHNFYAFIYYNQEQYAKAIISFKAVIGQEAIPESVKMSTIYSLAQLSMMQNDYAQTIAYLKQWMALVPDKVNEKTHVLMAQAHYQNKAYEAALSAIKTAIKMTEDKSGEVKENWLVLQRAIHYELKQTDQVIIVLEKMLALFDKPKYWLQLANMYGEVEREKEQLALMETANQRGFLSTESDYIALAQLYVANQVPYKGAQVMLTAMTKGLVEETAQNLKFTAQSLSMAKEDELALPVYAKAAALQKDGNLNLQLAQLYLNLEQNDKAIKTVKTALKKGELKKEGTAYLVLGMAEFNLQNYDSSLSAFKQAGRFKPSHAMAQQWLKYVGSEKEHKAQLALVSSSQL